MPSSLPQDKLQQISDQYDRMRDTGNQQLTSAYTEIAKMQEEHPRCVTDSIEGFDFSLMLAGLWSCLRSPVQGIDSTKPAMAPPE
eukprot:1209552-Amphidinium_carterae.1